MSLLRCSRIPRSLTPEFKRLSKIHGAVTIELLIPPRPLVAAGLQNSMAWQTTVRSPHICADNSSIGASPNCEGLRLFTHCVNNWLAWRGAPRLVTHCVTNRIQRSAEVANEIA